MEEVRNTNNLEEKTIEEKTEGKIQFPKYETEIEFEAAENNVSHAVGASQIMRMQDITRGVIQLMHCVNQHCPPSRERSLAITKLEEAKMWANAAISKNEKPEDFNA